MTEPALERWKLWNAIEIWFYRLAASGLLSPERFASVPPPQERAARTGRLRIEIVSHCWRYAHLLVYQLSSLVLYPPARLDLTMTVFYSSEDADTVRLLEFFGALHVPGVTWNWQLLDKHRLFRRAIGRNLAARATKCDWIWFTDCDVVFQDDCFDALAKTLQGRRDALVFPRHERVSPMLEPEADLLQADRSTPRILDVDTKGFISQGRDRATGPLQITHGDIARACGYCANLSVYQKPAARWTKAHEDRAFRWLLRTPGEPVDVPGVHRIRHVSKGRYQGTHGWNLIRTLIRRMQLYLREGRGD